MPFVRAVELFIHSNDNFIHTFTFLVQLVSIDDFIHAEFAFGSMHRREASQKGFVAVILFAVAVTELAVDDFWNFCGIFVSQCGFA